MHVCRVSGSNTEEISEHAEHEHSLSKHGENEVLLVLLCVDIGWNISHTGVELVFLVNENKVDQIPRSKKEY